VRGTVVTKIKGDKNFEKTEEKKRKTAFKRE